MKKINFTLIIAIILIITGCSSSQPAIPKVKVSKQFQFSQAKLTLSEKIKSTIVYHTEKELSTLLNKRVTKLLKEDGLLSTNNKMNALEISTNYVRKFLGEDTPIPSDSLAYPNYSYNIKVMDGEKVLTNSSKNNLTYNGGFTMNLQVIAGTLRDKKYEVQFIDALANTIYKSIKDLL